MSDERTRLERAFREVLCEGRSASELVKALADVAMKAPEQPTPRPVWPGLEIPEDLDRVFDAAFNERREAGGNYSENRRAGYTAIAAHLFRALVAGLPTFDGFAGDHVLIGFAAIPRRALAALADPYDGGGK